MKIHLPADRKLNFLSSIAKRIKTFLVSFESLKIQPRLKTH